MKVFQLLPELNSGGVERGTLEIARYLTRSGHLSHVISSGGRLVDQLEAEGSTHHLLPVHKKSPTSLWQVKALRDLIRQEQPDILHVRSRVPGWITYLAWRSLPASSRPRLISTVHGFYSVNAYSAVMTYGESVICVSNSVRDYVVQNYPSCRTEKLNVIHRGADPDEFPYGHSAPVESEAQKLIEPLKDKFTITLPGRVTDWKGQNEFIDLIALLIEKGLNVHGFIAGGAHHRKQDYYECLQKKVESLNLLDHISFLGDRTDLKDIMAVSSAVVSLSKVPEAFGRVTLEALSLGRPTLGYAHGGVNEQLSALYPAGLAHPSDIDEVAKILSKWMKEGAPPVPRSIHPFTLDAMCEKTLEVYQKTLALSR